MNENNDRIRFQLRIWRDDGDGFSAQMPSHAVAATHSQSAQRYRFAYYVKTDKLQDWQLYDPLTPPLFDTQLFSHCLVDFTFADGEGYRFKWLTAGLETAENSTKPSLQKLDDASQCLSLRSFEFKQIKCTINHDADALIAIQESKGAPKTDIEFYIWVEHKSGDYFLCDPKVRRKGYFS